MLASVALVSTDSPARYDKQLASHFSHKVTVDEVPAGHVVHFDAGDAHLEVTADHLVLRAVAVDAESLATVQRVAGGHLERFGQRDGLQVQWGPAEQLPTTPTPTHP